MEPGHSTKTCTSLLDICAKCTGKHPTQTCKVDQSQHRCASCMQAKVEHNHAAWDCWCPAFLHKQERMRIRRPENRYKYYPHPDHTWTWELKHDAMEGACRWMGNNEERKHRVGLFIHTKDQGYHQPLGSGRPGGYRYTQERAPRAPAYFGHGRNERGQDTAPGRNQEGVLLSGGNTVPTAGNCHTQPFGSQAFSVPSGSQQTKSVSRERGRSCNTRTAGHNPKNRSTSRQSQLPEAWSIKPTQSGNLLLHLLDPSANHITDS